LANYWYVACLSTELAKTPIAVTILGLPLVLFRDSKGLAHCFLDRCPHRNAPLSAGRVEGDSLRCGYHGWRFGSDGSCVEVPGLCGEIGARGRRATAYPTQEQDGYLWVYCNAEEEPAGSPYRLPLAGEKGFTTVKGEFVINGTLHATLENILDVPHTAFLHGGLFRTNRDRREITAVIRSGPTQVEVEFIGEERPTGFMGRILSPGGGEVAHFDRFMMPSIAQVEYRLGEKSRLLATQILTPESDFVTRGYVAISYRMPLPGWIIRPFVEPVLWRILKQDADMLQRVSDNVERFGGERYTSTELDVLGPHIWQLLRQAEKGQPPQEETSERRIQMLV
jgi:phenylpropionate dioxygenase-like ring-hydroxylating dioxygenase large terminal subunit